VTALPIAPHDGEVKSYFRKFLDRAREQCRGLFMLNHAIVLLLIVTGVMAGGTNDLLPKRGRGVAPPNARGSGPWATRAMLATSTNGLDFTRLHFVLSDQAGVPNVMVDNEQRARVYYVDFGNGNVLACAIQERADSLTNWNYRRVRMSGLPERPGPSPVDPTVVLVPGHAGGASQYRLYFMHADPLPSFYSAVSTNGFDFIKESGVRFTAKPEPCFDPIVLKTEKEWLLWGGGDGRFSARSDDGLNFIPTGEFRAEGARFMPWSAAALPKNEGYRLYGNFLGPGEWSGGVSSVFSRDGKTWKREPGIRLSLGGSKYALESQIAPDNGCALLPDGKWLMAYLATIPEPRRR
jgi:hypothetical protein